MKQGMTLEQLTTEVQRQSQAKQDFLLSTTELKLVTGAGSGKEPAPLLCTPEGQFPLTHLALEQLAGQVGMPLRYLRQLQTEAPNLLDLNINTLLLQKPRLRLIRTLDGYVRAVLSDRFKRLDHYEALFEAVWPVLDDLDGMDVGVCDMNPQKLTLKLLWPKLTGDIAIGDTVQGGVMISNSEVGIATLCITPFLSRLTCLNGAVLNRYISGTRCYHIGGVHQNRDLLRPGNAQLTLEEANSKSTGRSDAEFWNKVRSGIKAALDTEEFQGLLERLRETTQQKLEGTPTQIAQRLVAHYGLREGERDMIAQQLEAGGDLSLWSVGNAVTRISQDVNSFERATELESVGGAIFQMTPREWNMLSRN